MRDLSAALQLPSAYPFPIRHVDMVETHISWVFLAGPFAYKVKKPVNFGFVNYSTLERRRYFCEEEVRLNRRLAPDVYLGVVPIARWADSLRLEGAGEVVDYAVKMRHLPRDRMLDALLAADRVSALDVERLARRIAGFHRGASGGPEVDEFGSRRIIEQNWRENFDLVQSFVGRWLTHSQLAAVYAFVHHELDRLHSVMDQRILDGRIHDCHGDLRSESVWMAPDGGFEVFDCIEFNDRLRFGDVASEVAFLASDLDWRGRPDLAWSWVQAYVDASGDAGLLDVLPLYKCYRAFVRGKVEALEHQSVASVEAKSHHGQAAREHFDLAERYTLRFGPTLFLTCGQVGSGKTSIARGLASNLGLPVISSDRVRKELAGADPRRPSSPELRTALYQPAFIRRTYEEMYARARARLKAGQSVILDATFGRDDERLRAMQLARQAGASSLIIYLEVPESVIYQRLAARSRSEDTESDAGPEVFERIRTQFESPDGVLASQLVRVNASRSIGQAVEAAIAGIRQRLPLDHRLVRSA